MKPRRNATTQTTKITPMITVTHEPTRSAYLPDSDCSPSSPPRAVCLPGWRGYASDRTKAIKEEETQ